MSANHTHSRGNIDSQEDRFVYQYQVPSLQEMASHVVTKAIWLHDTNTPKFDRADEDHEDASLEGSQHLIKYLNLPGCIEEILRNSLRNINRQALFWGECLHKTADEHYFLTSDYEIRHIDPNWCVWSWNGEIDYRKSMKKMLEVGGLTEYQKFFFMAEFCMEDEIKTFSLDSLPTEIISKMEYFKCEVCFYWICYLKNELHKIPVEDTNSVDFTMAISYSDYTFRAEYFWNRLNDDDQVRVVKDWISGENCLATRLMYCALLHRVISKMSWHQQRHLLSEMADMIIIAFAGFPCSSQCVLWAWSNAKNEMTAERFFELISEILNGDYDEKTIFMFNEVLLCEIWDTAFDYQRNHAKFWDTNRRNRTKSDRDRIISNAIEHSCLEFLNKFLQRISLEDRKKWIFNELKDYTSIVFRCDAAAIDIFLPCPDDRLTFRKLMAGSKAFNENLSTSFECLLFDDLDKLLKVAISPDTNVVREYKQDFLMVFSGPDSCGMFKQCITNTKKWNKMSTFIDELFEFDSIVALKVKQQLITNSAASMADPKYFATFKRGFDDLMKIVEMVFSNNELRIVKSLFSGYRRELLARCETSTRSTEGIIPKSDLDEFHSKFQQWCSIDDDLADQ
ncbi:uncharacterized protein LOC135842536 isoform X2 [Planococcus citri]|uniref:uncharacterized protein LOC135842536 isoform X2 n=1 Tax=Planococcus citri TaxID=170843 RepID=UPI0031F901EA